MLYNSPMIIDFHTHIFSPKIKKNRSGYVARDACFAEMYSSPGAKIAAADELIAGMDKNGIDISVVLNIGWMSHALCVETNDYIMESVARYPKRLIGFGMIQPHSLDEALAEIERCAGGGLRGIGELRPDVRSFDLTNKALMTPLVEVLINHKLILLTHASEPVGHRYPGKGSITPNVLYHFITNFPRLNLVCAHWGGGLPFFTLMPEVKKALANVYFDTAASPFLYSPEIYQQVIPLVGADKVLFGSDYPLIPPGRLLKEVRSLGLSAEIERALLSGNAQRLLGI